MRKLNMTVTTILIALGCFSLSSTPAATDPTQSTKFTTIDVPGSLFTAANGINARGDIVGDYIDSDGNEHGFLLSK